MNARDFVTSLANLKFPNAFNPYADRCAVYDQNDAPVRRAETLKQLLEVAVQTEIDSLWIGRDLGYRGGRRTGLALTDDVQLAIHASRWNISVRRATTGLMVAERTTTVIWRVLTSVSVPVFLWNVFPLHPHDPDHPFSNRAHERHERIAGEEILAELMSMLKPRRVVAIGDHAARTAFRLAGSAKAHQVRHPSYGGQTEFIKQVQNLYALEVSATVRGRITSLHREQGSFTFI